MFMLEGARLDAKWHYLIDDAGLGDLDALDVGHGVLGEAEDVTGAGISQEAASLRLLAGQADELHLKIVMSNHNNQIRIKTV